MDRETFLNAMQELGTIEDDVERRTKLVELTDNLNQVFDDYANSKTQIDTLNNEITKNKEDMEKLREANMSLFLRIGESKTQEQITEASTGVKPEANKRKFEDLFKGGEN